MIKNHYRLYVNFATLFLVFCLTLNAQTARTSFSLLNLENKSVTLSTASGTEHTVIVLLLPDCPACQSYSRTLNQLCKTYAKNSVRFYGVFPGTYNTIDEMKQYKQEYGIAFPLLRDPDKTLVKSLHATTVPEVFLINKNGETVYSGRIDDWMYALGKKRSVITRHDLKDALNALLSNKKIAVSKTVPIGCIIE